MNDTSMRLLAVAAMLITSGCSSVTTRQPLPCDSRPIDQEKFTGAWRLDDSVIYVQFASNGVAKIAGVEWKDDQFRLDCAEAMVTEGRKRNFLSFRGQEKDGTWGDYFFLPYTFTDQGDLILWPAVPEAFADLVENEKLQGLVERDKHTVNVTITNSPETLLEIIDAPDNMTLFQYGKPVVLRKLENKKN